MIALTSALIRANMVKAIKQPAETVLAKCFLFLFAFSEGYLSALQTPPEESPPSGSFSFPTVKGMHFIREPSVPIKMKQTPPPTDVRCNTSMRLQPQAKK